MDSNSTSSLREALLSWLGKGHQTGPEELAKAGMEKDLGEGPSKQVTPSSKTDDLSKGTSLTSSPAPSLFSPVPIYDPGRERYELLRRLEALEASRGTSGGSAPPPPGFENFQPEPGFNPQLLDSMWERQFQKPNSDESYVTAETRRNSDSESSRSFYDWRPVGQNGAIPGSATSTPSQRSSTASANGWQYVRLPQVEQNMSDFRPFLDFQNNPYRAQPLNAPVPARNLTPSVVPRGYQLPAAPKPSLNVFPDKLINFANCHIAFSVHAINIPQDVPLASCKVDGVVITPSRRVIKCYLREVKKTTIYQMDFFAGTFSSLEEVGLYTLKVRLILPFNPQWDALMKAGMGVVTDEARLLISRNYYRESLIIPARSFEVDYAPWHYVGTKNERKQAEVLSWEGGDANCLSKAWGLTVDKLTNRFYYTDRNSHSLSCLDPEGRVIFRIPHPGTHSELCRPTGICCDEAHRRLIVVDKDNHRVAFFSMDGVFLSSFGSRGHGPSQFNYPWDVAVSPGGDRIVVTDSRNKRIQLFDGAGAFLDKFSVFEENPYDYKYRFDYPRGVTFNKDGTLIFLTDFNSNNILEVPLTMDRFRRVLPDGKLQRPQGIVVDELDNLLVCDSKNKCIRHVHPAERTTLSTIHSVGNERLQFPVNLALMGDGRVAVLGSQGRIRIF